MSKNYLFQCNNPDCKEGIVPFVFEALIPKCPKCENIPPITGTVALLHLGYYSPKGKLKGLQGRGVSTACGYSSLSNPFNGITSYLPLVNCPECKKTQIYKDNWVPDPNNANSYFENPNLKPEEIKN